MAAQRIEIDYLRAARAGDRVRVATWIVSATRGCASTRRFQVRRAPTAPTLARARIDYVCINLDTGRAARMPESFARAYVPTAAA